jgi:hypothetical protein
VRCGTARPGWLLAAATHWLLAANAVADAGAVDDAGTVLLLLLLVLVLLLLLVLLLAASE